ncbi:MAG: site-specific integrase [Clostridiales bacterium]|nr:site-specific integrase [Clostridiales bacterium]
MKGSIIKRGKTYSFVVDIGVRPDGKRNQKWHSGYPTKKEAKKAQLEILNKLMYGTYINPENTTVSEYLLSWLEDYVKQNLKETTYTGYKNYVEKHIIVALGNIKLQKLKALQIQSFYTELLKTGRTDGKGGLAPKTVLQIHRILSKALDRAYKLKMVETKETDYVEPPRKKKYKATILDFSNINKLLEAFIDTDIYIAVLLALNLGLRRGEVLGLRWSDIDFDRKVLTISQTLVSTERGPRFSDPKSDDSCRTLLISDELISVLTEVKRYQEKFIAIYKDTYSNENLVCCKKDGSYIHPGRFSHKFSDGLKQHNLPHMRFHDLRYHNLYKIQTFITRSSNSSIVVKKGLDIFISPFQIRHRSQISYCYYSSTSYLIFFRFHFQE